MPAAIMDAPVTITAPENAAPALPPASASAQDKEQEAYDFITRHILERDAMFFDG